MNMWKKKDFREQDKYAIGLPCPDTRGQKGIDFLDFLDSKGVRFSDVADGKMTLDEFMDILTLDDCINLLGGQPNTGCANTFGMGNLPEYGVPNVMTANIRTSRTSYSSEMRSEHNCLAMCHTSCQHLG